MPDTFDAVPEVGTWWRFYCWRCSQWCETRGPWCDLYLSEPSTSPCYFDEMQRQMPGARWPIRWYPLGEGPEPYEDVERVVGES